MEKNIPFVLLINKKEKKHINSVTIIRDGVKKVFQINPTPSSIDGLNYIKVENNSGILYKETESIIFGLPVINNNGFYTIESIEGKSVLYKEFPLIGSENFHLPVFVQHKKFKPTEERDGIRTKKEDDNTADSTADSNRLHLKEFINEYLKFISILIESNCNNLHHLALSGLPEFIEKYHNEDWYLENVQKPIRILLSDKPIVKNAKGNLRLIKETRFPIIDLSTDEEFFELLEELLPNEVPSSESLDVWNKIINQEYHSWNTEVTISLEQLLAGLPDSVDFTKPETYQKLKKVYHFLEVKNSKLGESYPIYLNEKNEFKTRLEVSQYPEIDDEMKVVSLGLGRNLDEEFLNKKLGKIEGIKEFELTEFYKTLNTELISKVLEKNATNDQINAILHVCSLFRSDRATKREKWYNIVKQLLPHQIGDKKYISIDYEYFGSSAELWTIKYISHLIETQNTTVNFTKTYFGDNEIACFEWINDFLSHVFSMSDEVKTVLFQRRIIPMQTGDFKDYSEFRFLEDNPKYFDETVKSIYKTFTGKGDPKGFLIDNRIKTEAIKKINIDILTKEIDKLFDDSDVEKKVKNGGILHDAFLNLNNWFEQYPEAAGDLKTFANKRAMLYVIALGEGFGKQVMSLRNSGKSMEDIAELAQINLSASEMRELERVANELGTTELLKKADEMIILKKQRKKWKQIGKTAEDAFKNVFSNLAIDIEVTNPDVGKDFELILKSDKFSVEIKNVIEYKPNVRMSILQGRTAVKEKDNYALCVVTRPDDITEITEEYFIKNAKFVKDIGYQIGDKIINWDNGLDNLSKTENINVILDQKTESVYVNKSIWSNNMSFEEFIEYMKKKFYYEGY
ncbi:hypothetical protein [Chryseobacterium oryzae]|uniref:Uncharacterized protein n=1 Tax=Chryseobacterium oryzae TaxID=2929799 RepID=A0ABY4BEH7_9FLAO|nr:hypothetical protein [Chryseobacterium oryzae]UOE37470.1 hypothetical protein MTP08_10370 [Chryseobacterium oryzae]